MKQKDIPESTAEEISRLERRTNRMIIIIAMLVGILITVLLTGILDEVG